MQIIKLSVTNKFLLQLITDSGIFQYRKQFITLTGNFTFIFILFISFY